MKLLTMLLNGSRAPHRDRDGTIGDLPRRNEGPLEVVELSGHIIVIQDGAEPHGVGDGRVHRIAQVNVERFVALVDRVAAHADHDRVRGRPRREGQRGATDRRIVAVGHGGAVRGAPAYADGRPLGCDNVTGNAAGVVPLLPSITTTSPMKIVTGGSLSVMVTKPVPP